MARHFVSLRNFLGSSQISFSFLLFHEIQLYLLNFDFIIFFRTGNTKVLAFAIKGKTQMKEELGRSSPEGKNRNHSLGHQRTMNWETEARPMSWGSAMLLVLFF